MSRSFPRIRARLSAGLVLSLLGVGYGLGGCGGEPSEFPPAPSLGPAPAGGKGAMAGSAGQNVRPGSGGEAGSDGGQPPEGGSGGSGGSTAGTTPGGSSGNGGSGGGDPNPNCGNDALDEGEECDDGNRSSGDGCSSQCKDKCETCEVAAYDENLGNGQGPQEPSNWRELCYEDTSLAESGAASGVERSILCHDLVECIRRTGCGFDRLRGNTFDFTAMDLTYCACVNERQIDGLAVIPPDCYDPAKFEPGPCFNQMLEAAEGETLNVVSTRLSNASFALGRAIGLIRQFNYLWCEDECMACTGPGALGNGGSSSGEPKGPCLPTR